MPHPASAASRDSSPAANPALRGAIEDCLASYAGCLGHFAGHGLGEGGEHMAPEHARLMTACAEICRTAAHFMLLGSPHHRHVCAECAGVCARCAEACDRLGMADCAVLCRRCAESCAAMAGATPVLH
jgi:hypothetical protein